MTNKIFSTNLSKTGCTRHLFATAFTPDGIITFIQNLIENYGIIYALNGSPGTGKSQLLNSICLAASRNGFDTEIYHHPLIPGKIEHILIPELNTAIVTSNELNKITFTGTQIYMENYIQIDRKNYDKSSAAYTKDTFNSLIQRALELLNSAKKLHDQLETCYIPNMNFKELDNVYDSLINKISGYEKEML